MKVYGSLKRVVQCVFATQSSAPASPASGGMALYFKTDEKLYKKNSSGTETEITSGSPPVVSQSADGLMPYDLSTLDDYAASRMGMKQYIGDGSAYAGGNTLSVTATGWTTTRAVFVPYQMKSGIWRLRFNFWGALGSSSRSNVTWSVSGVAFRTISGGGQVCSGNAGLASGAAVSLCVANSGAATIDIYHASATTTTYGVSGDVELNSKPNWVY